MPEDQYYKYILVCVDMYDGTMDAEPLKLRDNKNIIKAFKEIFKRKYLDYPLIITLLVCKIGNSLKVKSFSLICVIGFEILSTKKGLSLIKNEFQKVCLSVQPPPPRVDTFKNLNVCLLVIA